HEHIPPERQFAVFAARAIGQYLALFDLLAMFDDRLLVETRAGIGPHELAQFVHPDVTLGVRHDLAFAFRDIAVLGNNDAARVHAGHDTRFFRDDAHFRVARDAAFQAGADQRRITLEQRHSLTLHVRSHQRAV